MLRVNLFAVNDKLILVHKKITLARLACLCLYLSIKSFSNFIHFVCVFVLLSPGLRNLPIVINNSLKACGHLISVIIV